MDLDYATPEKRVRRTMFAWWSLCLGVCSASVVARFWFGAGSPWESRLALSLAVAGTICGGVGMLGRAWPWALAGVAMSAVCFALCFDGAPVFPR
jgi:hypothetical protein